MKFFGVGLSGPAFPSTYGSAMSLSLQVTDGFGNDIYVTSAQFSAASPSSGSSSQEDVRTFKVPLGYDSTDTPQTRQVSFVYGALNGPAVVETGAVVLVTGWKNRN
jgi:hypothetical protein